ncbi:ABC transporter permease [[Limnothrix rosea] IAM M-220]|uniref:ABC transporter permease n=1 Tax=[Limnothrix rosea] IAM M-220 TaxID=454133 RepID=UPI00095BAAC9|nr:ABC transporter permease [[Limnothrix rosea] IAM M-220]OKH17787.1 ABC transporter permease [[Limnothrix rosea] IAM M-220]
MNFKRIWAIATNCFREVIRDRILYFLGFYALTFGIAVRILPDISATAGDKIVVDFGLGMIGILSVLVAIFVGTGLVNKEIEKRTILVLIPKPISRAELIIGKHIGLSAVIGVMLAVMVVIYFGFLTWADRPFFAGPILVSIAYLFLELMLIVAVAIAFGVFTSSLLATLLSFGVYLVGHFSTDLVKLGELSENAGVQWITENLYTILPDLSRLNFRNDVVYGVIPDGNTLLFSAIYGIVYVVLLQAIAIYVLSRRQF